MANIDYVDEQGETFVVSSCSGCGRSYKEGKVSLQDTMPIYDERPNPEWNCRCGSTNEMMYHEDDCPCTMGQTCEQEYAFDTEEDSCSA